MKKNNKAYPPDNRNSMPFDVFDEENTQVGTFLLDPSTGCGDLLDLGNSGVMKVKSVAFLYKYRERKFCVVRKKLNVKMLSPSSALYFGVSTAQDGRDEILQ